MLCIGNSFSWDAVEQELVPLCDAKHIDVEIHNLYFGGCSLEQHVEFLIKDTAAYGHRVCTPPLTPNPQTQIRIIKDTITLRDALRDGAYDFISFQQASHYSGVESSYEPWLSILIDTVRAYQPHARLCWMQTWAYSKDATHWAYPYYHNDQNVMWDSIQACTKTLTANHSSLTIIPCGLAIQYARASKLGDTLCRDGYHLNYIYGRYTASCVWYEQITGKDVRKNKYKNLLMTKQQRKLTQRAAHRANKKGCHF